MATPGAVEAFEQNGDSMAEFLRRHVAGDWGLVDKHDWEANDQALLDGSRLLSEYETSKGVRFWIITEADRSVTTLLRPSEY